MLLSAKKSLIVLSVIALVIAVTLLVLPTSPVLAAGPTCTVPGTYSTIQAAIADVGCTTINVGTGTFNNTHLTIDRSLTLNGNGAASTLLDGGLTDRVITVTAGTVTISNLKIQNGSQVFGGGIYIMTGTATLNSLTVYSNTAEVGGGIANADTLAVNNSLVDSNIGLLGGGILNIGSLTMNNSQVTNGLAFIGGGIFSGDATSMTGAPIRRNPKLAGASATLTNSNVNNNLAVFIGGGIENAAGLTMNGGTLNNNTAPLGGGLDQAGFFIIGPTAPIQIGKLPNRRNLPSSTITFAPKAVSPTANLTNVTINNNTAAASPYLTNIPSFFPFYLGGGILNGPYSTLTLTGVGLSGNKAKVDPFVKTQNGQK